MSHNITNEGGVNGTIRLLKNIVGLWLIQECKRIWEKEGDILSYEEMMQLAEKSKPFIASFDPSKEQFLNPEDMASAIVDAVYHQSGKKLISKGEIVRTIMECLAFKYREVLDTFQNIIGRPIEVLHIIGGGAKNRTLNQFTANATGKIVIAGPSEATAIGNIIMQLIATGELSSLAEAREMVHRSFESEIYQPLEKDIWNEHYEARKNNK